MKTQNLRLKHDAAGRPSHAMNPFGGQGNVPEQTFNCAGQELTFIPSAERWLRDDELSGWLCECRRKSTD